MRARQEEECQELSKVIKYMSKRQEKLLAMMERKKSVSREAPEDLQKQIFQEIRELDGRISEKKWNCGEKQNLEEMLKEERQNGGREREGHC